MKSAYLIEWNNYSSFPEDEERRVIAIFTDEKRAIEHCKALQDKEVAQAKEDEEDESRPAYPSSYYGKYTYIELPLNPETQP
jgi:hypothetical protein